MSRDDVAGSPERTPKVRHYVEYGFYLIFSAVARFIGERNLHRFGALVGATAHKLVKRRTGLAQRNLSMIFPDMAEDERDRIVRGCWRHFCTMPLEFVRDSSIPVSRIASRFEIAGREYFEAALELDRAVLLLSAHFGSWEAALGVLSSFGRKVTVVGRRLDNTLLQQRLYEGRTRSGVELLDRRNAARDLVRAINEKAIIVLLVDQAVQSKEGEKVPFFGHMAWTTTAPARMAVKYKTPISTVFAYPPPADGKGLLEFEPMIRPDTLTGDELAPARIMQRINERIEARITRDPDLWLWFHDRWKEAGENA